jgi:hypothetical protein
MKKSSESEWNSRFKEGREDVQDDLRSGQQKTQWTDANADRVRALALSIRRLGVRLMAEEGCGNLFGGKPRTLAWQVEFVPWQCPCAWYVKNSPSSWLRNQLKTGSSTLFTWLNPLRFSVPSKIKIFPEGTKICCHSWHPTQRDYITGRYSDKQFSRLFPVVAPSSHEYFESDSSRWWISKQGKFLELNCHTVYNKYITLSILNLKLTSTHSQTTSFNFVNLCFSFVGWRVAESTNWPIAGAPDDVLICSSGWNENSQGIWSPMRKTVPVPHMNWLRIEHGTPRLEDGD